MRAVVTRCVSARVIVADRVVGELTRPGLLVLLGVTHADTTATAEALIAKLARLRILDGERSALDAAAPLLIVSQFTLYGSVRRGRRPSWSAAAGREHAEPLVAHAIAAARELGLEVAAGAFGEHMRVESVNDGPFTVWIDTEELAAARSAR